MTPQQARVALRAHAQRLREALDRLRPSTALPWFQRDSEIYGPLPHHLGICRVFYSRDELVDGGLTLLAVNSARAAALAFEALADAPCFLILGDNCASCKNAVRVAEALSQ